MAAWYNENDPFAAAWLRELITVGVIADGEVDERSVTDIRPADLRGFTQCHFFAGIGGWSYALRLAGWPDTRRVWTGSCPCQPYSAAGKGHGPDDPRDLWPAWFDLIEQCGPAVVFGEQVASIDGLAWFDRVSADMEKADYAIGAVDLCAPCVGAFHIRQRLYFVGVADDDSEGRGEFGASRLHERWAHSSRGAADAHDGDGARGDDTARCGAAGDVADATRGRLGVDWRASWDTGHADEREPLGAMADASCERRAANDGRAERRQAQDVDLGSGAWADADGRELGDTDDARPQGWGVSAERAGESLALPAGLASIRTHVEWIPCLDGKARPIESGTFPLSDDVSARVGRLRGYGNALVAPVAAKFIEAYLDTEGV